MPKASRACGDRIWRTGVFGGSAGFFTGRREEAPLWRGAGFFLVLEARGERREGEVFVATLKPP
jgi:hypothetical protein